jgi:hypothetical protein
MDVKTREGFLIDLDLALSWPAPCNRSWALTVGTFFRCGIHTSYSFQGTIPFLALSRYNERIPHRPHHDLESFYWVWVWSLLRHAPQQLELRGRTMESMAERVAVFESVFGAKGDLKDIFYAKESFSRGVFAVSRERVPLTLTLLGINRNMRRAHGAMYGASLEVDSQPTSERSVKAKVKAISLALKHHTFLNTFNECLSRSGWPDDDAAIPFHSVSRLSSSSQPRSSASSSTQPDSTTGSRKRSRDCSEDPHCIPTAKRFHSS